MERERERGIGAPFHMVLSKGMTFIFGWKSFVSRQTFRIPSFHFRCRFLRFGVAPKKCIKIYDSFRFFLILSSKKKNRFFVSGYFFHQFRETPWKMNGWNLQPSPIKRKENDLSQSSRGIMFHVNHWLVDRDPYNGIIIIPI